MYSNIIFGHIHDTVYLVAKSVNKIYYSWNQPQNFKYLLLASKMSVNKPKSAKILSILMFLLFRLISHIPLKLIYGRDALQSNPHL